MEEEEEGLEGIDKDEDDVVIDKDMGKKCKLSSASLRKV